MKNIIKNIRMGLATNSSSSHSIIILPKGTTAKDSDLEEGYFGWQYFTAGSKEAKKLYLAALLYDSLADNLGKDIAEAVVYSWLEVKPDPNNMPSVDHQSRIDLPRNWENRATDKEFFEDFKNFILRDDVVILGGNDNDGTPHPLSSSGKDPELELPIETGNAGMVCRKDGDHWVIFNRHNGTKLRLSFVENPASYTKAYSPELVDVKITDYCPFNCSFCYQGSTAQGQHAGLETIQILARSFNDMRVFEVALGGGEPTLHPKFVEILKVFKENNVVPNFTTKSLAWLKDESQRKNILEHCGNFAYSVQDAKEVNELGSLYDDDYYGSTRPVIHYVMGTGSEDTFKSIIEACDDHHFALTLLGYKTIGRGSLFTPKDNGKWLEYLISLKDNYKCPKIAIDTKLAQIAGDELNKAGIPTEMYHKEEGKFSMYVDAVNGLIAPSSYCDNKEMVPLFLQKYNSNKIILDIFAKF